MLQESLKKWKREANCIIANADYGITRKQILWWLWQIALNVGIITSDSRHVTMHLHWERSNNSAGDCSINGLSWMGKVPEEIPEVRIQSTLKLFILECFQWPNILTLILTRFHNLKKKLYPFLIIFPLLNIVSKSKYPFPTFQNWV